MMLFELLKYKVRKLTLVDYLTNQNMNMKNDIISFDINYPLDIILVEISISFQTEYQLVSNRYRNHNFFL